MILEDDHPFLGAVSTWPPSLSLSIYLCLSAWGLLRDDQSRHQRPYHETKDEYRASLTEPHDEPPPSPLLHPLSPLAPLSPTSLPPLFPLSPASLPSLHPSHPSFAPLPLPLTCTEPSLFPSLALCSLTPQSSVFPSLALSTPCALRTSLQAKETSSNSAIYARKAFKLGAVLPQFIALLPFVKKALIIAGTSGKGPFELNKLADVYKQCLRSSLSLQCLALGILFIWSAWVKLNRLSGVWRRQIKGSCWR